MLPPVGKLLILSAVFNVAPWLVKCEPETVVAPFRLTAPVPVLNVPAPLCRKLPEVIEKPVTPEIAPAEDISMLVVSRAKVPDPPPIDTSALLVPCVDVGGKVR